MNKQYINRIQDERIKTIEGHIETVNHELGDIKVNVAKISNDVCWLKRTYWIICTATIGTLVAVLLNFLKE